MISPHSDLFNNLFSQFGGGQLCHAALDNPYDSGEFLITFNNTHSFIHHDLNVPNTDGTMSTNINIIAHGQHIVNGTRLTVNLDYVEDGFSSMTGAIIGSNITLTPHNVC